MHGGHQPPKTQQDRPSRRRSEPPKSLAIADGSRLLTQIRTRVCTQPASKTSHLAVHRLRNKPHPSSRDHHRSFTSPANKRVGFLHSISIVDHSPSIISYRRHWGTCFCRLPSIHTHTHIIHGFYLRF